MNLQQKIDLPHRYEPLPCCKQIASKDVLMWLITKTQPIWQKLQPAQRGYALATICVLLWLLSFCSQQWLLYGMALSLLYAVTLDMWQGFLRIWNSLAGKAVIIVFYAILGNFCFAMAESQVNNLIGIRTDVVPFTVNLAVLLLAPIWSFGLSLVVLTIYTILHTCKIMLLLLLRPLGVRSHHILGDEAYPVKTLLARIVYLPVFMSCLAVLPTAYLAGDSTELEQMFSSEPTVISVKPEDGVDKTVAAAEQDANNAQHSAEQAAAGATTDSNPNADQLTGPAVAAGNNRKNSSNLLEFNGNISLSTIPWLNRTLAGFLYQIESMGRSSCVMSGQEHLVHINDYEVLVITPDKKAETGYQYQVRLCGSVGYRQPASAAPKL
jgi:hypothetical protein